MSLELTAALQDNDVVIVGSGAGGAMSAYALCQAGVKVLMLEAGRDYDPVAETPMFQSNDMAPLRGVATPDKEFGYYNATVGGGWSVPGEPYTHGSGDAFRWYRTRMLGGRTNHWGRLVPRFGPYDFKAFSRDGLGVDWPIEYQEVAPWYDRTEALVGVCGANSGLENHPSSSEGVLQPWPGARIHELFVKAACDDLGIPCEPARRAVLTRPIDIRQACFYATPCDRGCSIGAAFQTTTSLLPLALQTGNLTIITNAHAYAVTTQPDGRARGVLFVDKNSEAHYEATGRAVVLAASACETARILLNSNDGDGLGNGSGQVGRNLLDTAGTTVVAHFPALEGRPRYNEHGIMFGHMYIPWWLYKEQLRGELDFARGYQIEFNGGMRRAPSMSLGQIASEGGAYGAKLHEDAYRAYGSSIYFAGQGEMISSENCYCEIDPDTKDQFGFPVLRFHWQWSDQELNQVRHMRKTIAEIIDRLGGEYLQPRDIPIDEAIRKPGEHIHEVGTTRMGNDPDASVVNSWSRAHEIPNLMIADGGVFASMPHKNPTLTIMALSWRGADKLQEDARNGAL